MSRIDAIVPVGEPETSVLARRPDLVDEAKRLKDAALPWNTRRAIDADWRVWTSWCAQNGAASLPAIAATALAFVLDQFTTKKRKISTIGRYRATVARKHREAGCPSPFTEAVVEYLRKIRRESGSRQDQKAPLPLEAAAGLLAVQDRAVLLFGLATAFRRSELAALNIDDLRYVDEGIIVDLRRSKTDQYGVGRIVPVPKLEGSDACPVAAVRALMDLKLPRFKDAGGTPLFLSRTGTRIRDEEIAAAVKRAATVAGKDPKRYAGHSLRAGFVTWAWEAGYSEAEIMAQTGHKKIETLRRYIRSSRDVNPFRRSNIAEIFHKIDEMRRKQ